MRNIDVDNAIEGMHMRIQSSRAILEVLEGQIADSYYQQNLKGVGIGEHVKLMKDLRNLVVLTMRIKEAYYTINPIPIEHIYDEL